MKISTIIRLILTAGILTGAYLETGPWTTLSLFLITVSIEVNAYIKSKHRIRP